MIRLVWQFTREGNRSRDRMPGVDRAAFDAWDAATKRRLGRRAGLAFWKKTNTGGRVIISRHWPHKLCWDWSLSWEPYRGAVMDGARSIGAVYGYRALTLHLLICRISLLWQHYRDMPATRFREEAPVVRYPWGGIGGGDKGRLPKSIRKILEDADNG